MNKVNEDVIKQLKELGAIPLYLEDVESSFNYISRTDFSEKQAFIPEGEAKNQTCINVIKNIRWMLTSEAKQVIKGENPTIPHDTIQQLANIVRNYVELGKTQVTDREILLIKFDENNKKFDKTKLATTLNTAIENIINVIYELNSIGENPSETLVKALEITSNTQSELNISINEELHNKIEASRMVNQDDAYLNSATRGEVVAAAGNYNPFDLVDEDQNDFMSTIEDDMDYMESKKIKRQIVEDASAYPLDKVPVTFPVKNIKTYIDRFDKMYDQSTEENYPLLLTKSFSSKNANCSIPNIHAKFISSVRAKDPQFVEKLEPTAKEYQQLEKEQFQYGMYKTCEKLDIPYSQFQQEWEKQRNNIKDTITRGTLIHNVCNVLGHSGKGMRFVLNLQMIGGNCIERTKIQEEVRKSLVNSLNEKAFNPEANAPLYAKALMSPLAGTILKREFTQNLPKLKKDHPDYEKVVGIRKAISDLHNMVKDGTEDQIQEALKTATVAVKDTMQMLTENCEKSEKPFHISPAPTIVPNNKFATIIGFIKSINLEVGENKEEVKDLRKGHIQQVAQFTKVSIEEKKENKEILDNLVGIDLTDKIELDNNTIKFLKEGDPQYIWDSIEQAGKVLINPSEFSPEETIDTLKHLEIVDHYIARAQNNKEKNKFRISKNGKRNIRQAIQGLNSILNPEKNNPNWGIARVDTLLVTVASPAMRWFKSDIPDMQPTRHIESLEKARDRKEVTNSLSQSEVNAIKQELKIFEDLTRSNMSKLVQDKIITPAKQELKEMCKPFLKSLEKEKDTDITI